MFYEGSTFLVHHGIKGQKWGDRNGPPYPLDFDKLSPEEREKAKRDSIDRGDTVTAEANVKYYSASEIDELIKKNEWNKKLSSINGSDISKGEKFVKKFVEGADMYAQVVEKGSKVYNVTAKVTNAFGLTDLNLIGVEGKSKQQRELEALRFKKDMMQVQNDLKEAENKRKKLGGNKNDIEKLKEKADLLEQKERLSKYEKGIRENNRNGSEFSSADQKRLDKLKLQVAELKSEAEISNYKWQIENPGMNKGQYQAPKQDTRTKEQKAHDEEMAKIQRNIDTMKKNNTAYAEALKLNESRNKYNDNFVSDEEKKKKGN